MNFVVFVVFMVFVVVVVFVIFVVFVVFAVFVVFVIFTMKGKHFESIQDIEAAMSAQVKTLTKEDLQNCFRKWQVR
jgi:Ca2+/Na+ antiporter